MIEPNPALRDKYAIVGAGNSRLGKVPGVGAIGLLEEATVNALDDAGLTSKDIDGLLVRGPDDIYTFHQVVGERLGIEDDVEGVAFRQPALGVDGVGDLAEADAAVAGQPRAGEGELADSEIDSWVAKMQQARADKDYAGADSIRDRLTEQGIVLTREGWKRG